MAPFMALNLLAPFHQQLHGIIEFVLSTRVHRQCISGQAIPELRSAKCSDQGTPIHSIEVQRLAGEKNRPGMYQAPDGKDEITVPSHRRIILYVIFCQEIPFDEWLEQAESGAFTRPCRVVANE